MAIPVGSADWRCGAKRKGAAMPPLPLRIDEVIERAFRTTAFDDRRVSLWVMNCGVRLGWSCPLYPGEFNRSTQHYSPKLSGRGAEAILPLRTKIFRHRPRSSSIRATYAAHWPHFQRSQSSACFRANHVRACPSICMPFQRVRSEARVLRRSVESAPRIRTRRRSLDISWRPPSRSRRNV